MKIKLSRKSEVVEIEGEDGSPTLSYTLVEMSGRERDTWMTSEKDRTTWKDGKPVGIDNFKDIQAKLISFCLKDDKGVAVPVSVIAEYPSSVQKALFEAAQRLNGLTDESAEEEKKA